MVSLRYIKGNDEKQLSSNNAATGETNRYNKGTNAVITFDECKILIFSLTIKINLFLINVILSFNVLHDDILCQAFIIGCVH